MFMATLLDELLLKFFGFLGCSVVRWVGRSVSRSVSPGLSSPPTSSRPQFNATWLSWNLRQFFFLILLAGSVVKFSEKHKK